MSFLQLRGSRINNVLAVPPASTGGDFDITLTAQYTVAITPIDITKTAQYKVSIEKDFVWDTGYDPGLFFDYIVYQGLLSTFKDSFDDNSISSKWVYCDPEVSEASGKIQFNIPDGAGAKSIQTDEYQIWDLDYAHIEIVEHDVDANHGIKLGIFIQDGLINGYVDFGVYGNNIIAYADYDGDTVINDSTTYVPTSHRWLRIRYNGGTLYFEAASERQYLDNNWQVITSTSYQSNKVIKIELEGRNNGSGIEYVGKIDNFNLIPTATTAQKSTQYTVLQTFSTTKSAQYVVASGIDIQKFVVYTIPKDYTVTKNAVYAVATTPSDKTKSSQYAVARQIDITKSASYLVSKTYDVTKTVDYDVARSSDITKNAAYAVALASSDYTINKNATYAIARSTDIQKSSSYVVISSEDVAKTAQYTVPKTYDVTKSAQYSVATAKDKTTSSQYYVATTANTSKTADYVVLSIATKQLTSTYVVISSEDITKTAQYQVPKDYILSESAIYTVPQIYTITKNINYLVAVIRDTTKSATYVVLATQAIQKTASYVVISSQDTVKVTQYTVPSQSGIAKTAQYTVPKIYDATKAVSYSIAKSSDVTKTVVYDVLTNNIISKTAGYVVVSGQDIAKSSQYTTLSDVLVQKTASYTTWSIQTITVGYAYFVQRNIDVQLASSYRVTTTITVQKGAQFFVATTKDLSKTAGYVVESSEIVSKVAQYQVPHSIDVQKSVSYVVVSSEDASKVASYAVPYDYSIGKAVSYAIARSSDITKQAQYLIAKTTQSHTNLVPSRDFEASDGAFASGWAGSSQTGTSYDLQSTDYAKYGTKSYRGMRRWGGLGDALWYLNGPMNARFYPRAGTTYIFSAWVYIPIGSPITAISIQIRDYVTYGNITTTPNRTVTAGQWTRVQTVPVTAGSDPVKAWRITVADPAGVPADGNNYDYYVDGVWFEEGSTPTDVVTYGDRRMQIAYFVPTITTIQKTAQYVVISSENISKTGQYTVPSQSTVTKNATYAVASSVDITKQSQYTVPSDITKQLTASYVVNTGTEVFLPTTYKVLGIVTLTQQAQYYVARSSAIEKQAQYLVAIDKGIQKQSEYLVGLDYDITKNIAYNVAPTITVQKQMVYVVISSEEISKVAQYTVPSTGNIQKTNDYDVAVIRDYTSGGTEVLCDSYGSANYFSISSLRGGSYTRLSQSFTGNGGQLSKARFYLKKNGTPTGNINVYLYSHSGTYGSNSVPSTLLATSTTTYPIANLTTSVQWVQFNFNQYTLTNGTRYVLVIEYTGGDSTNRLDIGTDSQNPVTHSGNMALYFGTWTPFAGIDTIFEVYTGIPLTNGLPTAYSVSKNVTITKNAVYEVVRGISKTSEYRVARTSDYIVSSVVDGYTTTSNFEFYISSNEYHRVGQSFTGDGGILSTVVFKVYRYNNPTGNMYYHVYEHTGTFGSDGLPTGSPIATSDPINVSTLLTSGTLTAGTFSGANRITLNAGQKYVAVIEYTGGNSSNDVTAQSSSSGTHNGNVATWNWNSSSWSYLSADLIFSVTSSNHLLAEYVVLSQTTITKQTQYHVTYGVDGNITLGSSYAVATQTDIDISAQYSIWYIGTITLASTYAVSRLGIITKIARYRVLAHFDTPEITSGFEIYSQAPLDITASLPIIIQDVEPQIMTIISRNKEFIMYDYRQIKQLRVQ